MGADTLKPARHLVGRPQASPNAQNMLVKGPRSISGDLRAIRPPLLAVSLDSLNGGLRVAGEELCQDGKNEEQVKKTKSRLDI